MSKKEKAGNPVKEAKLAYQQFLTENNISDIKSIKDAKLKKKHKALLDAIEAAEQARTGGAKKDKKSKTPAAKKGNPQFARKYDYPKDVVTADEKKKYRILQRRLAKQAAAGASPKKATKEVEAPAPKKAKKKANVD